MHPLPLSAQPFSAVVTQTKLSVVLTFLLISPSIFREVEFVFLKVT